MLTHNKVALPCALGNNQYIAITKYIYGAVARPRRTLGYALANKDGAVIIVPSKLLKYIMYNRMIEVVNLGVTQSNGRFIDKEDTSKNIPKPNEKFVHDLPFMPKCNSNFIDDIILIYEELRKLGTNIEFTWYKIGIDDNGDYYILLDIYSKTEFNKKALQLIIGEAIRDKRKPRDYKIPTQLIDIEQNNKLGVTCNIECEEDVSRLWQYINNALSKGDIYK